jgi:hypothetical protein
MPQPVVSDVHVSAALSNISVAYLQDATGYVADKIFPIVPVQHQADKYFIFKKDDYFRDQARQRADGTESAGAGYNLSTGNYSADVWALHKDLGEQVRRNADPAIDLEAATTEFLTQQMLISRDRTFVANYIKTGVWGTDMTGAATADTTHVVFWDDDVNGDPVTDIANAQTKILQNTGKKPNVLLLGWPVYQALRKHPLIIDRIKYTNPAFAGTVTPQLLASLFDVEEVVVAEAVYNSAAEGVAGAYNFIMGKSALLCYRAKAPSLMLPTAGYIFAWQGFTGLNNIGVRTNEIPMPWLGMGTSRIESEMAFDMQVVGADLGYFFSNVTQ